MSKRSKNLITIIAVMAIIALVLGILTAVRGRVPAAAVVPQNATPARMNDGLLDTVREFYDAYNATPASGKTVADTTAAALKQFGTQNAVDNFRAHEKACIQNTPRSVSADNVATLENPYRVDVTYDYDDDSQTVIVTVVNDNNVLKINDISC